MELSTRYTTPDTTVEIGSTSATVEYCRISQHSQVGLSLVDINDAKMEIRDVTGRCGRLQRQKMRD